MTQQVINLGAAPNDGTGDDARAGGDKINDNFTELYASVAGLAGDVVGLPAITSQTQISLTLSEATPSTYVAFPSTVCDSVIVRNDSRFDWEVRRGGAGASFILPSNSSYHFVVTANANELSFRWADYATNATTIYSPPSTTIEAVAITGGRKYASAVFVSLTYTSSTGAFTQFGSQACSAIRIPNYTRQGLSIRIGASSGVPTKMLYPWDVHFMIATNTNVVFIAREITFSPGFNQVITIEALTLKAGQSIAKVDFPPDDIPAAMHILESATFSMRLRGGTPSTMDAATDVPAGLAFTQPYRVHVKAGRKPLGLFQTTAGITASADPPVNTTVDALPMTQDPQWSGLTVPRVTLTGNNRTYAVTALSGYVVDMTAGNLYFSWKKVSGTLTASNIRIFSSGSPTAVPANYHELTEASIFNTTVNAGESGEIECLGFPGSAWTAVGGGATLTAVTWALVTLSGAGAVFDLYGFEYAPNALSKGCVVFTFDDSIPSPLYYIAPLMQRYGFPGVLMTGSARAIGGNTMLTQDHMMVLQNWLGWQICPQDYAVGGTGQGGMADLSGTGRDAIMDLAVSNIAFAQAGLLGGPDSSFGSPAHESNAGDRLARKNYKKARRTMRTFGVPTPWANVFPFANPWRLGSHEVTTVATTNIDYAIDNKAVTIIVAHGIPASGATLDNIVAMVEYCKTNEANVSVVTMEQLALVNERAQILSLIT